MYVRQVNLIYFLLKEKLIRVVYEKKKQAGRISYSHVGGREVKYTRRRRKINKQLKSSSREATQN